jgi:hypothetical protein
MAKKKPAKIKKPVPGREVTGRKVAGGNAPARKAVSRPAAKKNPRQGARVVAPKKKPPAAPAPVVDERPSLGRPKVTGDEDLDLFFKEDFHARQIFKYLGVQTVKELERYSASEILRRLSEPIKKTVERVRQLLAQYNRCLHGDETYALDHKVPPSP